MLLQQIEDASKGDRIRENVSKRLVCVSRCASASASTANTYIPVPADAASPGFPFSLADAYLHACMLCMVWPLGSRSASYTSSTPQGRGIRCVYCGASLPRSLMFVVVGCIEPEVGWCWLVGRTKGLSFCKTCVAIVSIWHILQARLVLGRDGTTWLSYREEWLKLAC